MKVYVYHAGSQIGPLSPEEVNQSLVAGSFSPSDLAWFEGLPSWKPLSWLRHGLFKSSPPPLPTQQPRPRVQSDNRFMGLRFERLRFEHDKRQRRLSGIEGAMRREERQYNKIQGYDLPFGAKDGTWDRYMAAMEKLRADLDLVKREMQQIEEAMDKCR